MDYLQAAVQTNVEILRLLQEIYIFCYFLGTPFPVAILQYLEIVNAIVCFSQCLAVENIYFRKINYETTRSFSFGTRNLS